MRTDYMPIVRTAISLSVASLLATACKSQERVPAGDGSSGRAAPAPCEQVAAVDTAGWRRVAAGDGHLSLLLPPSLVSVRTSEDVAALLGAWAEQLERTTNLFVTLSADSTGMPTGDMNGALQGYARCTMTAGGRPLVVTSYYTPLEDPGQVVTGELELGPGRFVHVRVHTPSRAREGVERTIVASLRLAQ